MMQVLHKCSKYECISITVYYAGLNNQCQVSFNACVYSLGQSIQVHVSTGTNTHACMMTTKQLLFVGTASEPCMHSIVYILSNMKHNCMVYVLECSE